MEGINDARYVADELSKIQLDVEVIDGNEQLSSLWPESLPSHTSSPA